MCAVIHEHVRLCNDWDKKKSAHNISKDDLFKSQKAVIVRKICVLIFCVEFPL